MKSKTTWFTSCALILAIFILCKCSGSSDESSTPTSGTTTGGTGTVSVLATPSILAIDTVTFKSVTIHWNAVSGATGYDLFRDTSASGTFTTQVNSTQITTTSYTDTSLSSSTVYYYKLQATDGASYSAKSVSYYCTTVSNVAALYPPPSSISVSEGTFAGYVQINWGTITGYSVTGYNVYRTSSYSSKATKLNTSTITALTYSDTTAVAGTIYYYYVCGVDSSGNEGAWTACKFGFCQ
jgi:hypothetical protein